MESEVKVEFKEKESVLGVRLGSYDDIVRDGRLEDEFLDSLFEGYRSVENSERKRHEERLSPLIRLREIVRRQKTEYKLPVEAIHFYPATVSKMKSEYVKEVMTRAIGLEAEYNRLMADRWELVEDVAVGLDLLIDVGATTVGLYRYVTTGDVVEGFAGFGNLALVGMLLLVTYFILRIKGEEPCKRRNRYLTHILRTPMTIHRTYTAEKQVTFYANSEGTP